MKTSTLIGIASLAANATLVGVLLVGSLDRAPREEALAPVVREPVTPAAAPVTAAWSELTSSELVTERDRLEAEGFPPSAVRAIIAAQIRERFAARRKAIEAETADLPFWKSSVDPRTQAQLRAVYKEEQNAVKDVLGPDPINGPAARLRRQFPDLAPEKVDQLAAIRERFDEQRQDLYSGFRGVLTPGERERLGALEKAMHAEFAAVLSPAELENYDLRTSNTANNIRFNLSTFQPSEAEFRAIYRLQSAYDEQFGGMAGPSLQDPTARRDAMKQLSSQIEAALGPARYADYQRSSDYNYQQTSRLVARLGLPAETATSLHAVQKEFEERRTAFFNQGNVDRDRASEHLGALQKEATGRVTTVLGGNVTAVAAYRENGGTWLANFAPRLPPPPPRK